MDWGDTSCYSRHFLISWKELKDAPARTKIKILILTFPTAQSLQLSGMIKKEQINFGNLVIMMSKFGSKSERGNIKFYVFLGTSANLSLVSTFSFLPPKAKYNSIISLAWYCPPFVLLLASSTL